MVRSRRDSREGRVQNRALTEVSRKDKADMVNSLGPATVNNCGGLRALRVISTVSIDQSRGIWPHGMKKADRRAWLWTGCFISKACYAPS